MNTVDKQYFELCRYILNNGFQKGDRTGTGTISAFGYQMRFDLNDGFPLLTTKRLHVKSIIHELLWFLSGDTNIKYLQDNGVHIWDAWSDDQGNLGKVYGHQWRSWEVTYEEIDYDYEENSYLTTYTRSIDQISDVIEQIKNNPDSRRLIVSAWNVGELDEMALPPCHLLFQFYVANGKLSCQLYQRSADVFLGLPFNIASYSLLTMMIAQVCDLELGEFIHTLGDAHIYNNHIEQVITQLRRDTYPLPQMKINSDVKDIFNFKYDDFELVNYVAHPHIKGEVSV